MNKLICSLILSMLFLQSYGQGKNSNQADSLYSANIEWSELKYKSYSIERPVEWKIDTSGSMGLELILMSPMEIQEDQFMENVNLATEVVPDSTITLEEYVGFSTEQILSYITDSEILSSKKSTAEDLPHHQIEFTGRQGIFDLYFTQRYYLINHTAYILTMTTRESTQNKYKWYIAPIFDSFQIVHK